MAGVVAIAAGLGAVSSASASQVGSGVFPAPIVSSRPVYAVKFVPAPWEANTLTVEVIGDGHTVIFRDSTGVIGANPPAGLDPCVRVSQHEARCSTGSPDGRFAAVDVGLGDAGSSYRDLTPATSGDALPQTVTGSIGNDDIAIRHVEGWIFDGGGHNRLESTGLGPYLNVIVAHDGIGNTIVTRNGRGGDVVQCDTTLPGFDIQLADHGFADMVDADPGDTAQGCENAIGG